MFEITKTATSFFLFNTRDVFESIVQVKTICIAATKIYCIYLKYGSTYNKQLVFLLIWRALYLNRFSPNITYILKINKNYVRISKVVISTATPELCTHMRYVYKLAIARSLIEKVPFPSRAQNTRTHFALK